ncbi:hypothetical protein AeMF1_007128, partial [Aphanomyces euteiches]
NNNYSASKKGKGNNNHDNDNQGHAIDNSEPGKQAERNAVQESTSTGAYGMAVDDDALNKGNINDEKREVLLDEVDKSKKAEYNKHAREKKREAPLKEVDKSKKAEYNKRAYGKKRHAIVDTVDEEVAMKRSKKAEDNKRAREKSATLRLGIKGGVQAFCTIWTWIRATKRSPRREKTDSITTLKVTIISSFWQLRSKKITSAELTIEESMRYNLTV